MATAVTGLPPAVDGDRRETHARSGPLGYYVAGKGDPMLLLHSVNAAASAYEMKPIFERYCARYRTYLVDFPGFGISDRSDRRYDIRLFVDAVLDMLDIIETDAPGVAVHVAALSLGSEFAARASTEVPDRFRSLALITPTGFAKGAAALRAAGATKEVPGLSTILRVPLWRGPLFGLLVRKKSIRYFLERTYGSKAVDDDMVDYDYFAAHQPGAEHAPFAFLSGRLFSRDIRTIYEAVTTPVWVAHGTKGDFRDFSEIGWTSRRDNWSVDAFDTGALVHYERPEDFFAAYDRFLSGVEQTTSADVG